MHLGTHHRSPGRMATRVVLLIALATASLTLTHCRMVGDRLTGVGLSPLARSGDCVKQCNDRYNALLNAENDLHKVLIRNCNYDPACLAQEEARHLAAMESLKQQRDNCKNECHKQGGISLGP